MASRKIGTCIRSSSTLLKHFVSSMASDAASSSDRPAKLRKIEDFRRQLPYVSLSALQSVLDLVEKEGVPQLHSRKHAKQAVEQKLRSFNQYGPLLDEMECKMLDGTTMKVPFCNLLTLLQGCYAEDTYFCDLLNQLHTMTPSSLEAPWHGILYADEVHPGNQLSSSGRKTWAIYFSFLQMTPKLLSDERNWFTLMVLRSDMVAQLEAGIGQCIRILLEKMFGAANNRSGTNPLHGVALRSSSCRLRLFFGLNMFLQDGSAQKFTFSNRQDSGSKMCMCCKNIWGLKSGDEDFKLSAKFLTRASCHVASDEEILSSWDRLKLKEASLTKGKFKDWQQATGWTYSTEALLMSEVLRSLHLLKPISQYCFDWMHGLCSNGVLNYVIFWTLQALKNAGMNDVWRRVCEYMKLWCWPLHVSQKAGFVAKLFEDKAVKGHNKDQKLRCSASEVLSLHQPLRHFLLRCCNTVPCDLPRKACLSWLRVLEILLHAPLRLPNPGELLACVEEALQLCVDAEWSDGLIPKFHWTLHFEDQVQRFRAAPSCFTMERKHKHVRRYGSGVANTKTYESTILQEVTCDHVTHLTRDQKCILTAHLVDPHPMPKKLQTWMLENGVIANHQAASTSSEARLASGAMLKKGDYVLFKATPPLLCGCAEVFCLLQTDEVHAAVLSVSDLVQHSPREHFAKWKPRADAFEVMDLKSFLMPLVYNKAADGTITTLLPMHISVSPT